MKFNVIHFATAALLSIGTHASENRIEKIERVTGDGVEYLTVSFLVCKNSFPTLAYEVSKISEKSVIVKLSTFPGPCNTASEKGSFAIGIESEIKALGLDPKNTEVFIQIQ
jgi:hypothetical protein